MSLQYLPILAGDDNPFLSQAEFSGHSTLLVIGFNLVWMIWEVQSQNWAMEAILQAFSRLIVVLLFAEIIVITQQVNSEL